MVVGFHSDLLAAEDVEESEESRCFLEGLPQLPEEETKLLESRVTFQELSEALQGLNKGKDPDIAGLPVEFYKTSLVSAGG